MSSIFESVILHLRRASVLLALPFLISPSPGLAEGPGNLIAVLEDNLRVIDPAAGELLACVGEGHLRLTDAGMVCDGQLDFDLVDTLRCASDGGLCIIENVVGRMIQGCDSGAEAQVEVELTDLRRAGSDLELSWSGCADALRAGCTTCGLCGNFDDAEEDLRQAIDVCPDVNQDGASDLIFFQDSLRCLDLDPAAPPLMDSLTLHVSVPCDSSDPVAQAVDAFEASTRRSTLATVSGGLGIEVAVDSM